MGGQDGSQRSRETDRAEEKGWWARGGEGGRGAVSRVQWLSIIVHSLHTLSHVAKEAAFPAPHTLTHLAKKGCSEELKTKGGSSSTSFMFRS